MSTWDQALLLCPFVSCGVWGLSGSGGSALDPEVPRELSVVLKQRHGPSAPETLKLGEVLR